MRIHLAAYFPVAFLLLAGCSSLKQQTAQTTPRPETKDANIEQVVASVNANSRQIQSVRCDSVDIDARGNGQSVSLSAKLAYQRSQKFRLTATVIGKDEVDLGSNEKEIWFWLRRAETPAVYFCNREDLPRVKFPTPFQPDWIIDVLGVNEIDLAEYRQAASTPEYYTLVSEQKGPNGQPVLKRVVIDRQTSRVVAYQLYDARKPGPRPIVEAWIRGYHENPSLHVYTPQKIDLEWPEADTHLTITLKARLIQVNTITPQVAATVFRRGEYSYTKVVNLAQLDPYERSGNMASDRQPSRQTVETRQEASAAGAAKSESTVTSRKARGPGFLRFKQPRGPVELTGDIQPASTQPQQ